MRVLGISAFYHDAAAALVCDGEIVAAAQEERFTRKKHDARFPRHAVEYCLSEAKVSLDQVDLVAFYDKNGLEARVAVNYRKEYLRGFGQNQNTGAFGSEPTFENPNLQIDFSTSYAVTKQISVFAEALNLTNETQSTHGRFDNQLLDVFAYGRRYTAGARFRF